MLVGHLEVITGSMFSGKTEELIRRVRRALIARRRVAIFKPSIDHRYRATHVYSHAGRGLEATLVDPGQPGAILSTAAERWAEVVAIDEAQFFSTELIEVVRTLIDANRRVILSGLDMDFAGRPFGVMPTLLAMADEVLKLKAICARCGEPAHFTQRLINGRPASPQDPLVVIGGAEAYEARCRRCYELGPTAQESSAGQDATSDSASVAGGGVQE